MDSFNRIFAGVSKMDDHEFARLEKRLKALPAPKQKDAGFDICGGDGTTLPDISKLDAAQLAHLERKVKDERGMRRGRFGRIDPASAGEEEWRDLFDQLDVLRQPDSMENKGATIDFPFTPAEYFRHARISLRRKLMRSAADRREVFEAFMAGALSHGIVVTQAMRLWLDKLEISGTGFNFQNDFIARFGTINSVLERKEKHITSLFESIHRIESLPGITIDKVAQLNIATENQQVNNANDFRKSPPADKEGQDVP